MCPVAAAVAAAATTTTRPPVGRRCGGLRPRARHGAPPPHPRRALRQTHRLRTGAACNSSAGGCAVTCELPARPPSCSGSCATGAGRLNAGQPPTHGGPPRCIRCGDAPAAQTAPRHKGSRTYLQRSRATPTHPRGSVGEPFFVQDADAPKQSCSLSLSRPRVSARTGASPATDAFGCKITASVTRGR